MNDTLPPKKPLRSVQEQTPSPPLVTPPVPLPRMAQPDSPSLLAQPKHRSGKKILLWVFGSLGTLLLMCIGVFAWYTAQLQPLAPGSVGKISADIAAGSSPAQIGLLLEEKKIIRSHIAFDIYTRLSGTQSALQAGLYSLSPSESTEQIVAHLTEGRTDEVAITFLPGATVAENKAVLLKAGYAETEIDAALGKTYDHPLFTDKPASADLEGYIFGETYHFDGNATVEQILVRTFDEYYEAIKDNNLIESFRARGLNLYEGITLASIIQREVPGADDQKQVAQVFFTRLAREMVLGSDVTYQYAAKKLGVTPSPSLESPYNTRRYPGLPPGPIAVPGLSALWAVAAPATGDFLYFLSGDDNKTYFSHTNEEHEAAIRDHCQVKCLLP